MRCTSRRTALYEWRFLRGLMRAVIARKAELFPEDLLHRRASGRCARIRDFDDKIVARYCGFNDADDYYHRAAAARVVDRIAVPTLILLRAGRSVHPALPGDAREAAGQPAYHTLWRRATAATARTFPGIAATRFTGRRPR